MPTTFAVRWPRVNAFELSVPVSICDGLLSYDVGEQNWPILKKHLSHAVAVPDLETRQAMRWLYEQHGLRTEPSGAIATLRPLLSGQNIRSTVTR